MKIGSHVSMSGKEMFLASAKEAVSYGATTLMVYTGAPQNTRRKPVEELNIENGWAYLKENGIEEIVVHAPYIINIGNTLKPETYNLGVSFLKEEIRRAEAMGARQIVLHSGAHVGAGEEAAIKQIIKGLNEVLTKEQTVQIALETMSGKGSECGKTFEELKMIFDGVELNEKLSVCMDTCHIHDAGYDIVNDYEGVLKHFDEVLGLDKIKVLHINDSKNACGAAKDRHESIGEGFIGLETLKAFCKDKRFKDVPKILETPLVVNEEGKKEAIYEKEIALLKK